MNRCYSIVPGIQIEGGPSDWYHIRFDREGYTGRGRARTSLCSAVFFAEERVVHVQEGVPDHYSFEALIEIHGTSGGLHDATKSPTC